MRQVPSLPYRVRVAARFHPPHSLLGLAIRRRVGNAYDAETWYLVVAGVLLAALLVVVLAVQSIAGGAMPVGFWAGVGLVPFLVLAGLRRGYVVSVDEGRLEVRRGREHHVIDLRRVREVSVLDPHAYHRGDARDDDVIRFVNDRRHRLVRVAADEAVLVVGVPPAAEDLLTYLRPVAPKMPREAFAEA